MSAPEHDSHNEENFKHLLQQYARIYSLGSRVSMFSTLPSMPHLGYFPHISFGLLESLSKPEIKQQHSRLQNHQQSDITGKRKNTVEQVVTPDPL